MRNITFFIFALTLGVANPLFAAEPPRGISKVRQAAINKMQSRLGSMRGSIKPAERHIYLTNSMIEQLKPIRPHQLVGDEQHPKAPKSVYTKVVPSRELATIAPTKIETKPVGIVAPNPPKQIIQKVETHPQPAPTIPRFAKSKPAEKPAVSENIVQEKAAAEKPVELLVPNPAKQAVQVVRKTEIDPKLSLAILRPTKPKPAEKPVVSMKIGRKKTVAEKPAESLAVIQHVRKSERRDFEHETRSQRLHREIFKAVHAPLSSNRVDTRLITNSTPVIIAGRTPLPNVSDAQVLSKAVNVTVETIK